MHNASNAITIFFGGQRLIQKTYKGIVMDQEISAMRSGNIHASFQGALNRFVFANGVVLGVNSFATINSQQQLALTAFAVVVNLLVLVSLSAAIDQFQGNAKDYTDNSNFSAVVQKTPWAFFRVLSSITVLVVAITQVVAIYS